MSRTYSRNRFQKYIKNWDDRNLLKKFNFSCKRRFSSRFFLLEKEVIIFDKYDLFSITPIFFFNWFFKSIKSRWMELLRFHQRHSPPRLYSQIKCCRRGRSLWKFQHRLRGNCCPKFQRLVRLERVWSKLRFWYGFLKFLEFFPEQAYQILHFIISNPFSDGIQKRTRICDTDSNEYNICIGIKEESQSCGNLPPCGTDKHECVVDDQKRV